MCTIMTTTGSLTTLPEFGEAFALTKYRGPDDTRIVDVDSKAKQNQAKNVATYELFMNKWL